MQTKSETTFVTVATFMNTFEAELARNELHAAGIHAFLIGQPIAAVDWIRIGTIGGIRLQVPSDEAERTSAILEKVRAAQRARKQRAEAGTNRGHESTRREEIAYRALKAALFGLIFFLFVPFLSAFFEAYAIWLVVEVKESDQRLLPDARRSAIIAAVIGGASILVLAVLLLLQLRGIVHL